MECYKLKITISTIKMAYLALEKIRARRSQKYSNQDKVKCRKSRRSTFWGSP